VIFWEFSLLLCPRHGGCAELAAGKCLAQGRIDGQKRRLWPTASTTPASRQAPNMRSASARVSASGFSQKICFPARAQATTCAGCSECGVAQQDGGDGLVGEHGIEIAGEVRADVGRKIPARPSRQARRRG